MRDDPDLFGPIISRACAGAVAMTVPCDKLFEFDAVEFGPQGITTNAIAPGYFSTETNAAMVEDPTVEAFVKRRIPLQRWGEPKEIAGAAVFLASDAASYVNGVVLTVDGGLSASF